MLVSSLEFSFCPLTPDELQALALVAQGLPRRQIADQLTISFVVLKHRLRRISIKLLRLPRCSQVWLAISRGWIEPPGITPAMLVRIKAKPPTAAQWNIIEQLAAGATPSQITERLHLGSSSLTNYADRFHKLYDTRGLVHLVAVVLALPAALGVGSLAEVRSLLSGCPLTPRELEALNLVARNLDTRQIGAKMNLTCSSVKDVLRNLSRKLPDANNRAAWLQRAYLNDWIKPPSIDVVTLDMITSNPLTARQWGILNELRNGLARDEVAAKLVLTKQSVKHYLEGIYARWQIHTMTRLMTIIWSLPDAMGLADLQEVVVKLSQERA